MNPLDYLTEGVRTKLVDAGLTKLANAAERAGSHQLAATLRVLRSDTPFLEDVSAGLGRALDAFAREWGSIDPELTSVLVDEPLIRDSPEFLTNLAGTLVRPVAGTGPEFDDLLAELLAVVTDGVPGHRVRAGLEFLVAKVREELFTHPKLIPVHMLFLQRASLESQVVIIEELRAIRRENSTAALGSDPWPRELPGSRPPRLTWKPAPVTAKAGSLPAEGHLPDILTPVIGRGQAVAPAYEPLIGGEAAGWLAEIQAQVISSIENADFDLQERIAGQVLRADIDVHGLRASAHYLLGEAKRLQADFTDDFRDRARSLDAALEAYSTALDVDRHSPRALRGIGRIHEVRGDIGNALELYGRARAAALHAFTESDGLHNQHAHEILRATRHYVSCVSESLRENPRGRWARHSGKTQLHGLVLESEDLHRSVLPQFATGAGWRRIEWFMGLVLLAKGHIAVGDGHRAWLNLLHALAARVDMMDAAREAFSPVERGNLLWWCKMAKSATVVMPDFSRNVEEISHHVTANNMLDAWAGIEEMLLPLQPPWGIE